VCARAFPPDSGTRGGSPVVTDSVVEAEGGELGEREAVMMTSMGGGVVDKRSANPRSRLDRNHIPCWRQKQLQAVI